MTNEERDLWKALKGQSIGLLIVSVSIIFIGITQCMLSSKIKDLREENEAQLRCNKALVEMLRDCRKYMHDLFELRKKIQP